MRIRLYFLALCAVLSLSACAAQGSKTSQSSSSSTELQSSRESYRVSGASSKRQLFEVKGQHEGRTPFNCHFYAIRDGQRVTVTCTKTEQGISLNNFRLWLKMAGQEREAKLVSHPRWGTGTLGKGGTMVWELDKAPAGALLRIQVAEGPISVVSLR